MCVGNVLNISIYDVSAVQTSGGTHGGGNGRDTVVLIVMW